MCLPMPPSWPDVLELSIFFSISLFHQKQNLQEERLTIFVWLMNCAVCAQQKLGSTSFELKLHAC